MEALVSEGAVHETPATFDAETNRSIDAGLIPLLNWQRLYRTCWRYREKEGYTNLTFDAADLRSVIEQEHYVLHCPEEMIECERLDDLSQIESIVLRILRTYITEFYSDRKQAWERETMQYEELTEGDDNLVSVVEARVKRSAQTFLDNLLERLEQVETEDDQRFLFAGDKDLYRTSSQDPIEDPPPRVYFEKHLYHPLVTQEDEVVKYSPPGLNTGERAFIEHLRTCLRGASGQELMGEDRELYVLRNQTRGKGVGFQMQEGGRFFPDFILWLIDEDLQHILFVDPKGLEVGSGDIDADSKVSFCQNIKSYEETLNQRAGRDDVRLHAFILSTTSFRDLKEKQTLDTREDFHERKVHFLEDGSSGVLAMLRRALNTETT
jgi:hypothetical protein